MFCIRIKSRSVVTLLRHISYRKLTTSLSGLFSTLRLVFRRYKLYSECLTTTIQKQNYNRASEIHLSVVNGPNYMLFCRKRREEKKNCPKQTSLFVVDDNSFKLTSPGKVLGGEIFEKLHFRQNGTVLLLEQHSSGS